jgi:tetratricopeptide (TPR) repeat protein
VSGGPPYLLSPEGKAVADGAAATGGGLHQASGFSEPTLAGTFRRAFEDFRNSYVLRYTPQGVQRAGWHDIEVRLPRSRSYTVRSRSGYLVEAPAPAPVTPPVPEVPRTLHELTDAYERGAYRQVVTGLRMAAKPAELLRDFAAAGNPWPAAPRKEAAFALDLVEPAVFSQDRPTREAAYEHLARFARLIRPPLEPDTFERYWYFAALTLLEGSIHPDAAESFATRALARFPDEPRFHLSRAIATDQQWATRSRNPVADSDGKPKPAHVELVRERYTAAAAMPATAVEARIRLAWFLHRIERHEEALDQLALAGAQPVADASMRYLHHLFRGHALAALGRHDQAVEAFRAALAVVPSAQSARVALMNTLLVRGDRDGAEALAEHVQTESNEAIDPWWMYWQGQYRMQPQVMARVRELSR